MADDNVTSLDTQKQNKDPKQTALNRMKEAVAKEMATKIEAQVKKTVDAIKIANNEKKALTELLVESEESKSEFADLIKEI